MMPMPTSMNPLRPTRVLLVTRHAAALQWLQTVLHAPQAGHVAHLDSPDGLQAGDIVAGNLPMELAATLCEQGVVVLGIDLRLTPQQRGRPLSVADMQAAGARLRRYRVQASPWPEGLHQAEDGAVHAALASTGDQVGRED